MRLFYYEFKSKVKKSGGGRAGGARVSIFYRESKIKKMTKNPNSFLFFSFFFFWGGGGGGEGGWRMAG